MLVKLASGWMAIPRKSVKTSALPVSNPGLWLLRREGLAMRSGGRGVHWQRNGAGGRAGNDGVSTLACSRTGEVRKL